MNITSSTNSGAENGLKANEARFVILGEPKGKGRPRFSAMKGKDGRLFTSVRTPNETIIYENLVRMEYEKQCNGVYFQKDEPVEIVVRAFLTIPQSTSKKKAKMMLSGELRPMKKPDVDNLIKGILDAVNRIAYYDDKQVVDMHVSKFYSEIPRVEVTIRKAEKGVNGNAQ